MQSLPQAAAPRAPAWGRDRGPPKDISKGALTLSSMPRGLSSRADTASSQAGRAAAQAAEPIAELARLFESSELAAPEQFNLRTETLQSSEAFVRENYPDLVDLVQDGSLVVLLKDRTSHSYSAQHPFLPGGAAGPGDCGAAPSDRERLRAEEQPPYVFIVGTAHVSAQSATAVRRVIEAVRPDNVVVELCRSRIGTMYSEPDALSQQPEKSATPLGLSGATLFDAVARTLRLGGQAALLFRFALSYLAERTSGQLGGLEYGAEFRAARSGAEDVSAQLVLGDRPIEITLKRAWNGLSLLERLRLAKVLLEVTSWKQQPSPQANLELPAPPTSTPSELARDGGALGAAFWDDAVNRRSALMEEVLAELQKEDSLSQLFKELGQYFPSLLRPLIHERDAVKGPAPFTLLSL